MTDSELKIEDQDYYPAEMCYWRNLVPYDITSKITCRVTYQSDDEYRRPDILYLDAVCKVVNPDFISNLKSQRLRFDDVFIGASKNFDIILQNIQCKYLILFYCACSYWNGN